MTSLKYNLLIPALITITAASFTLMDNTANAKKVKLNLKSDTSSANYEKKNNKKIKIVELDSATFSEIQTKIKFFGFEKNASSTKENFFIVNDSPIDIKQITISLLYKDLSGRMLHCRKETIYCDVPAGETRILTINSFDNQGNLYYHKSKPPRKGGMPFEVEISLLSACSEKKLLSDH